MERQKTMVSPGSPGTPAAQLSRGLISFLPLYTLSPTTCLLGEPGLRHKVQLPTVDGPGARPGAPQQQRTAFSPVSLEEASGPPSPHFPHGKIEAPPDEAASLSSHG